ncbi:UDP-N-acetylglucosamine 2-epimerase [Dokdonia sp. Asnod1-B02]|uniref:UDP-N-acetylglucosamine 2-epimerase n=1 Tax=Dokdonia sp. Asnod1-B02 TaxID=3160573 RepID=UPI00386C208F
MKVAVATGTRADFGLLRPLIQSLKLDTYFELTLIVTAMHLSKKFGFTRDEVEASGFSIDFEIPCLEEKDDSFHTSKAVATALVGFAKAIEDKRPDLLIILGDRTEMLSAAIACTIANVPIAHIHGGETTEGAYDESIRHSITKMSYLHFTAAETYRKRVIQLGEHPDNVFNVGAIGIDSIRNLELLNKDEFEKSIDFTLFKYNILVTYHPVTLEGQSASLQFMNILNALNSLTDTAIIFTHANSDRDGSIINKMIDTYCDENKEKTVNIVSLGQLRYLSALRHVDVVLGNSSSGVLEVPYFSIPTIDIGDRQKGRLMSESVINCDNNLDAIKSALSKSFDQKFRAKIKSQPKIYGNGTATEHIIDVLKSRKSINLKKSFYDLPK